MKVIFPFIFLLALNLYLILRQRQTLNEISFRQTIETDLSPERLWSFLSSLFTDTSSSYQTDEILINYEHLEENMIGSFVVPGGKKTHRFFLRCADYQPTASILFIMDKSSYLSGSIQLSIRSFLKQTTLHISIQLQYTYPTLWVLRLKYRGCRLFANSLVERLTAYESTVENPLST